MLKIISLNVNSIVYSGRRALLFDLIKNTNADIYLLQETKLDETIHIKFAGYNIVRNDKVKGEGGVAIVIKNNIPITGPKIYNKDIQAISIQIKTAIGWIGIVSCYFPPAINTLPNQLFNFFNTFKDSFIGGDLNARHTSFGDANDNQYGISLVDSIVNTDMKIINPPHPTCFRSTQGSFIDKFMAHNDLITSNVEIIPSFSDHNGISINLMIPNTNTTAQTMYQFQSADMEKINKMLENHINAINIKTDSNLSINECEQMAAGFGEKLKTAVIKHVPKVKSGGNYMILSNQARAIQNEIKKNCAPFIDQQIPPYHTTSKNKHSTKLSY